MSCPLCGARSVPTFRRWGFQFHRCEACFLEFIHPQPDDATLARMYSDDYFLRGWSLDRMEPLVRAMKRATFRRYLLALGSPRNGARLLDCGAATGFMAELARETGWDAFAVEISAYGAERCAARVGADHAHRGTVEECRFAANPERRFEAITMIDFIEHVRDPARVLTWAREHLVGGGRVLLVTPRAGGATHRLMGRSWPHYTLEHLWYLNPANVTRLLNSTGFTDVHVSPAPKALTLAYMGSVTLKYSQPRWRPVVRTFLSVIPRPLACVPLALVTGDMLVLATLAR